MPDCGKWLITSGDKTGSRWGAHLVHVPLETPNPARAKATAQPPEGSASQASPRGNQEDRQRISSRFLRLFRPGAFQRDRSVEHKALGRGVLVEAEVAQALKLVTHLITRIAQTGLALGDDDLK